MHKTILSTLCAVLLALPACGGDEKKTETKVTQTETKTVTTKTETEKTAPEKTAPATDKAVADADKKDDVPPPDPNAEKVQLAATVAREISADPEKADEILTRHKLDREQLDALMFEIASNPDLTQAYMAARKAAT